MGEGVDIQYNICTGAQGRLSLEDAIFILFTIAYEIMAMAAVPCVSSSTYIRYKNCTSSANVFFVMY